MCISNNESIIDKEYIDEALWNIKGYHSEILTELDNISDTMTLGVGNDDYDDDDIFEMIGRIKSAYSNYVDVHDEIDALDNALEEFFCIGDSDE